MPRPLVDLLWRDHHAAPTHGRRGPKARLTVSDVVSGAVQLADSDELQAVTVRALGEALGISAMSVYTHVNTRDDLLVLMVDQAHADMDLPAFGRAAWRTRVRRLADANGELLRAHPWLTQVTDPRIALGPGTIAKYDHELRAFDGTGLDDLDRDAALTFVLDFVRANALGLPGPSSVEEFSAVWADSVGRLESYLGADFALAQRVGRAAGERTGAPYDADHAWDFGFARVIAGLADLVER